MAEADSSKEISEEMCLNDSGLLSEEVEAEAVVRAEGRPAFEFSPCPSGREEQCSVSLLKMY